MTGTNFNIITMNLPTRFHTLLFFTIIILLCSCIGKKTNDNLLLKYFNTQSIEIDPNISAIIVISENSCLTCNQKFAEFAGKHINKPHIKYIVTAEGGLFDTRIFENAENVFIDYENRIHENGIIKSSGVIFLKRNMEIDSIINIEAYNIIETFEYLDKRLD